MSFQDLQQVANTALFASSGFGEPVLYTAPGAAPENVMGIFDERPVVADALNLVHAPLNSSEITLALRQADLATGAVVPKAQVVVRGVLYDIREIERPDDSGVVKCKLRRFSGA